MKPSNLAKLMVALGGLAAGCATAISLFPRLQQGQYPPADVELAAYAVFAADGLVSLVAGALVAYLFYFCLWECLVRVLAHLFQRRR